MGEPGSLTVIICRIKGDITTINTGMHDEGWGSTGPKCLLVNNIR